MTVCQILADRGKFGDKEYTGSGVLIDKEISMKIRHYVLLATDGFTNLPQGRDYCPSGRKKHYRLSFFGRKTDTSDSPPPHPLCYQDEQDDIPISYDYLDDE